MRFYHSGCWANRKMFNNECPSRFFNSYFNTDTNPRSNSDPNPNPNSNPESNSESNANSDPDPDTISLSNPGTDPIADTNAESNTRALTISDRIARTFSRTIADRISVSVKFESENKSIGVYLGKISGDFGNFERQVGFSETRFLPEKTSHTPCETFFAPRIKSEV